ncbi:hypothetical protein N3K66_008226 [Trichothecium roseum]|uniref:Uncharacterized protein n=1 Tax=Trichothecium roseum TaxID=47278 RepID=A0ACC0UUL2_9HYPO|nr:hypothetical protein N3K66_008226 [Trichothecium roseum]
MHSPEPLERSVIELGHLLSRLQQTILHPDPERERKLRTSEYERARVGSNLGYARAVLTQLEKDAIGVTGPARKGELQRDLHMKVELWERLDDRMKDLQKMAADNDDDDEDDEDSSEGEDILAEILTPSESMALTSADIQGIPTPTTASQDSGSSPRPQPASNFGSPPSPTPASSMADQQQQQQPPLPTHTSQTLRARGSATSLTPSVRSQSHSTARAALFASRRKPTTSSPSPAQAEQASTATAEALLDRQARERDGMAEKVYEMARAMRRQQDDMADALGAEKELLGRTAETMERSAGGMRLATGRLGQFARMTEGKGWWGRVILYAWVYGLMLALVLLVFVLPKLRL